MNPEVKVLWIEALRSGNFKQGTGALASVALDGSVKHCCLGVLCELVPSDVLPNHKKIKNQFNYIDFDGRVETLPESVMKWAGLKEDNPNNLNDGKGVSCSIAEINDFGECDFNAIADIIEKQL